ncbi:MAG: hypothetical protein QF535_18280, partial [Anaerolineales bacterium]|nr:hypothetical protein [Anaerolineales bacterium]
MVFAEPAENLVCCQETKSGDFCSYEAASECKPGSLMASTSCELTSYCQTGCCFDNEDGLCYPNAPKSRCEDDFGGEWSNSKDCSSEAKCELGCCLIGTQGAYVTEGKCRDEVSKHVDITMDFRTDVGSEQACVDLARAEEKGCCVTEDSCQFGTAASCSVASSETTGFHAGQKCSDLNVGTCKNCVSTGKTGVSTGKTGCLPNEEDVFKFDSCGNPDGILGGVGGEGDCDYLAGTLCGDSDGDGEFTCESVDCSGDLIVEREDFEGSSLMEERSTVLNGESWCMFDDPVMQSNTEPGGKDPVGSRYYRGVCINGKEFVEPCADYRKEWCVDGGVEFTVGTEEKTYVEAQCRENRWQSCIDDCNTADVLTMDAEQYKDAIEDDNVCCNDVTRRDCSWVKNKCVPKASPGFKFWEDDGSDTCSKADMSCKVILHCPGWNAATGECEEESAAAGFVTGLTVAVVAGLATAMTGGAALAVIVAGAASGTYAGVKFGTSKWTLVYGAKCLSSEY